MRAITSCGSEVHLYGYGAFVATAENSWTAGIANVIKKCDEREAANRLRLVSSYGAHQVGHINSSFLNSWSWVDESSDSYLGWTTKP